MNDYGARIAALPIWSGAPSVEPLKGGLSNASFIVTDGGRKHVARFGEDFPCHHVSREREIVAARAAHAAGLAPELIHAEAGAMVFAFIEGKTFEAQDVRANLSRIADILRRFHRETARHVVGAGAIFWAFHVIRDYARTIEAGRDKIPSAWTERLPEFLSLAEELEAAQRPMPIVFGHHDLLPANLIDDGGRLWLIDFEYAAFGTPMFDLAGVASNAECSAEEAEELLTAYLGAPPAPDLLRSHAAMGCASLIRESMWAMVSELHLNAPGVDYADYARETLERLDAALAAYRAAH